MEPIISPWFIYLLHIVDSVRDISAIVTIFLLIALAGLGVACGVSWEDFEKETILKIKKWLKINIILGLCFSLIFIFVPNKRTIIAMYITDNITTDNVERAINLGKDFKKEIKKDIFEFIEKIQGDEKESSKDK